MSLEHETFSVLICRKQSTSFNEINFLMQIAWSYAEKGLLVFILSGKVIDSESGIDLNPYLSKPEVLQRIIFRYISEPAGILEWCHEMHKRSRLPHVFMLGGLETFTERNEFNAVEICAALLDAVQYCSLCTRRNTYLLVSICDNKSNNCPLHLITFFDQILYLENSQTDSYTFLQLYPFTFPGEPLRKVEIKKNY
ncbi:hypothetical protein O3M35_001661 [Rhynocoris fuscipes]|uniref:Uncharacterized protein n=1 Tax=Rhynocoris fuscipes TaxID=488301 RepID=A0AAW1CS29_9HEMI